MRVPFLIVGAGPTGLGAAHSLLAQTERFLVVETQREAGGLAGSVTDDAGFTWDFGGHVQFSHYELFDQYMDRALGTDGWIHHARTSSVWIFDRFVPYPLQTHLDGLPDLERSRCEADLSTARRLACEVPPDSFQAWIDHNFGGRLAEIFMVPYNRKVWAYPLESMSAGWVGERVAMPSANGNGSAARQWGPNSTFRFPVEGGTGAIWRSLATELPPGSLCLGDAVVLLDATHRVARLASGEEVRYEHLISTVPVDRLTAMIGLRYLAEKARRLAHSSTHVIGIGLEGEMPETLRTANWMYFPDPSVPFYRTTVLSNYSPRNAPHPGAWSLMAEVAESAHAPVDSSTVVDEVVAALRREGLIAGGSRIVSQWHRRLAYGYPVPTLERDSILAEVLPALEHADIYSRGRFGAWKYEVSNQDHSFMQGWECAERIAGGLGPDHEVTLNHPEQINWRPVAPPVASAAR